MQLGSLFGWAKHIRAQIMDRHLTACCCLDCPAAHRRNWTDAMHPLIDGWPRYTDGFCQRGLPPNNFYGSLNHALS